MTIAVISFLFLYANMGFEPVRVSALRKQFSELFLAESERRLLNFIEIQSPSERILLAKSVESLPAYQRQVPQTSHVLYRCVTYFFARVNNISFSYSNATETNDF